MDAVSKTIFARKRQLSVLKSSKTFQVNRRY